MRKEVFIVFIFCCQYVSGAYWTTWKDKDNPSGTGDYETIGNGPKPCGYNNALKIQARVGTGGVAMTTKDRIRVGPAYGLYCFGSSCSDYKVSYGVWYPDSFTDTKYYDASTPGSSDNERIYKHGTVKDHMYLFRIRFKVVGSLSKASSVTRKIDLGPKYGLKCTTAGQLSWVTGCPDYHVRYQCSGIAPFKTSG